MFVVWPGSKKTCLVVPSPLCTLKGMMDEYNYSPRPQVCLPFAVGVQMHITLWSADTCMTKVDSWWPCRIPITNLSITVSHGRGVGEDIHRLQDTYLHGCILRLWQIPPPPDAITSDHEGKMLCCNSSGPDVVQNNTHMNKHQRKMH